MAGGALDSGAPMRIVHVLVPAPTGGLERVVQQLATAQRRVLGLDVTVAAVVETGQPEPGVLRSLRESGVPVEVVSLGHRAYREEYRWFAALCRERTPDVVHSHGYHADTVDAWAARRQKIPIVSTSHGFTGGGWKNRAYQRLQVLGYRRFDAVVAVSQPLGDQLVAMGVARERLHVIPNASTPTDRPLARVEARAALGLPADGFVMGWVGRVSPEKGLDVMIDALAELHDPGVRLAVIGDGAARPEAEEQARARGVASQITWAGLLQDADRHFQAFDALLLSSRTEGIPMVLFEAMAAETPIVATRVGGVPSVLGDEEALLVPSEDPAALASAIRRVRDDREGAAERARSARARLEKDFSAGVWVERYQAVYEGIRRGAR